MGATIALFDVDGVLVQPGGYRAAVRETVNHFTRLMGLGDLAPDDATVAIYEAQGITCEWDMIPITLALILEEARARVEDCPAFDSLDGAIAFLNQNPAAGLRVDYAPVLRTLGKYVRAGEAPADTLLAAVRRGEGPFRRLAGQRVLEELLSNTRRPARSRTTHVFETFVLGDAEYTSALGLPVEVRSPSLLAQHDRALLSPSSRDWLAGEIAAGRLHAAAYTARPSTPRARSGEPMAVFAPEAEAALRLVGLDALPLVGSGQVGESALRLGESEDRLTKPAPYHALAAIGAAWSGRSAAALEWMEGIFRAVEQGAPGDPLHSEEIALPRQFSLHIFEDSPIGMAGGVQAARLLAGFGLRVDVRLWGVTTHPEKAQALQAQGASVFADVNQALARFQETNAGG